MRNKLREKLVFLPALIWMVVIFYFSSRQRVAVSGNYWISFAIFKTLHLIEYAGLFFLWHLALKRKKNGVFFSGLIAFLYAITDELHQSFIPTREGRLRDVFIDGLGIILCWRFFLDWGERLVKRIRPVNWLFFSR